MMPLVAARGETAEEQLASRVQNTRRLLTAAALIMSVYLITTSFITTVLIPPQAFADGGQANGRALAYLAHQLARRGLRHRLRREQRADPVVRRSLGDGRADQHRARATCPRTGWRRSGAAPSARSSWSTRRSASSITLVFRADVNAQAGAYATGILAMMVSGALAVTVSAVRRRHARRDRRLQRADARAALRPGRERASRSPTGSPSPALFIAGTVVISIWSRLSRAFELRVTEVDLDATRAAVPPRLRTPHGPARGQRAGRRRRPRVREKRRQSSERPRPDREQDFIFVEITVTDPSEFATRLDVHGEVKHGHYRVLTLESRRSRTRSPLCCSTSATRPASVPTSTSSGPRATRSPTFHFLALGVGEVAPTTREVLRRAEPDRSRRPYIHTA